MSALHTPHHMGNPCSGGADAARVRCIGLYFGLAAYLFWGLSPAYWRLLSSHGATPVELICHRAFWGCLMIGGYLAFKGQLLHALSVLKSPKQFGILAFCSAMVGMNWGLFIWGIGEGRLVECSLGYFLFPLVNILVGMVVLKEKLRRTQMLALIILAVGLINQILYVGTFPWLGLSLAISFAAYSTIRRTSPVPPLEGLFLECFLGAPFAAVYLFNLISSGQGLMTHNISDIALAIWCGAMTVIPLGLHVLASRRVETATLSLMFYINPACQFILGVMFFGEPLQHQTLITFCIIWAAITYYILEGKWHARRVTAPV